MTFRDESNEYTFAPANVDAYSYGIGCPDFDLSADISIIHNVGKRDYRTESLYEQPLGNSLNSKSREKIPFGEEYYKTIRPKLSAIVERELRANNEQIIRRLEKLTRIMRRF
jgi:hypothetical protein